MDSRDGAGTFSKANRLQLRVQRAGAVEAGAAGERAEGTEGDFADLVRGLDQRRAGLARRALRALRCAHRRQMPLERAQTLGGLQRLEGRHLCSCYAPALGKVLLLSQTGFAAGFA